MSDPAHDLLLAWRPLSDGRELHVEPLTFGRARLNITEQGCPLFYSDGW